MPLTLRYKGTLHARQARRQALDELHARGFDRTFQSGGALHPRCSCCDARLVQGIATHETGCLNARHECSGCHRLISAHDRYCEECQ